MSQKLGNKTGCKKQDLVLKECGWCGKIMERLSRSPAQYAKISAHKECASFWAHYKKSEKESRLRDSAICESCGKTMVRRTGELAQSWVKRRFCDKSCAATASNACKRGDFNNGYRNEKALGLIRYKPGTTEFERIAKVYLERGL